MFVVPGNVDGGGNQATGNVEPQQCEGVVCTIGEAPGAPQTILLEGPPADSATATRRPSSTRPTDDTTPLIDIVFECRIDTHRPAAVGGLRVPGDLLQPHARASTPSRSAPSTPTCSPTRRRSSVTWTYARPPAGQAPDTFIDLTPPAETPLFEALFTFTSNEPDVTFECQVDALGWQPCGQEQPPEVIIDYSFFVAEFEDFEVGAAHVPGARHRHRGHRRPDARRRTRGRSPAVRSRRSSAARPTSRRSRSASRSPVARPTRRRRRSRYASDNAPDSTYECSLDFGPFVPCNTPAGGPDPSVRTVTYTNLLVGEHIFRVFATSPDARRGAGSRRVRVGGPRTARQRAARHDHRRRPGDNTQPADVRVPGHRRHHAAGAADVRVRPRHHQPGRVRRLRRARSTSSSWPDRRAHAPASTRSRCAPSTRPIPTASPTRRPTTYTWTHVLDIVEPQTTILGEPAAADPRGDAGAGHVHRQRQRRHRRRRLDPEAVVPPFTLVFECSLDGAPFAPCESPVDHTGLEPGAHTLSRTRRRHARQHRLHARPRRTWTVVGPPVTTFSPTPPVSTTSTTATFAWPSDQTPVTYTCTLNGGRRAPCALAAHDHRPVGPVHDSSRSRSRRPTSSGWSRRAGDASPGPSTARPTSTAPDTTIIEHPLASRGTRTPRSPSPRPRSARRSSARSTARRSRPATTRWSCSS